MTTEAYKEGALKALDDLGLNMEEVRSPYPRKNPELPAERLTELLQEDNEEDVIPKHIPPENKRTEYRANKPVSWGSPIDLSGMSQGQRIPGLLVPGSPRS
ncbi:MAG: hypothetical protein CMK74_00635 [Pseudomonadales bacterium]|nr:hypothetical protein [Pseudomonadales bacterium]